MSACISADNYGNGVASAHLMAKARGGKGEIGLIFHAVDFFVTRQRHDAFKKTIAENYPDIEIVAEQGIGGPNFSGEAQKAASAMLTAHGSIKGIWAVWAVPAEGVISAARTTGRNDLVITTIDLGENVAIDMAHDGFVKGLGAQRPYDQGVTRGASRRLWAARQDRPGLRRPARPAVTKDNLLDAWQIVYRQPAPLDRHPADVLGRVTS